MLTADIINPFPCLRFENLIIKAIQATDLCKITQYFLDNRDFLAPWEPLRPDSFFTQEGWARKLIPLIELQRHGLSYYFLIFEQGDDDIKGVITYNSIIHFPFHSCHLGYSLAEKAQGRGLMRRSLQCTNQWMFDNLNMHRLMAAYIHRNKRSAAVLKATGFVKEGEAKKYLLINDHWEDHVLTSLINPNWQAKT